MNVGTGAVRSVPVNVPMVHAVVSRAEFTPDGNKVMCAVTGQDDEGHLPLRIVTIDTNTGNVSVIPLPELAEATQFGVRFCLSPDGRTVGIYRSPEDFRPSFADPFGPTTDLTVSTLTLIDLKTGQRTTINTPQIAINPAANTGAFTFTPDGRRLVNLGQDRIVVLERATGETYSLELPPFRNSYDFDIALTPDGRGGYFGYRTVDNAAPEENSEGNELWFVDFENRTVGPAAPGLSAPRDHSWESYSTGVMRTQFQPAAVVLANDYLGPPGEKSRITRKSDGTFVRTMTAGRTAGCGCDPLIEYDARGLQTAVQDEGGRRWLYTYDPQDRLITITHPGGEGATTLTYSGSAVTITDPASRSTRLELDAAGDLVRVIDPPGGGTRLFEYDAAHRLIADTNRLGSRSTVHYDARGMVDELVVHGDRITRLTAQDTVGLSNDLTTGSAADPATPPEADQIAATVTDPDGIPQVTVYNGWNAPTSMRDALGNVTKWTYTKTGQKRVQIDPLQRQTRYSYTHDDAVESIVYPDATGTRIEYVTIGSRSLPTRVTLPSGAATSMTYDSRGLLASERDATARETIFTYTSLGLPAQIIRPSARAQVFSYAGTSALEQIELTPVPGGGASAITHITYDAARNPIQTRDPLSAVAIQTFDGMGRLVSVTDPDSHAYNFTRDEEGNITDILDPRSQHTVMTWASGRRLTSKRNPLKQVTEFSYSPAGRLLKTTNFRNEFTERTYDTVGRLQNIKDPLGGLRQFTYNAGSELESEIDELNRTTIITRDLRGRVKQVDHPIGSSLYTYTPDGHLASTTDASARTWTFEYDPAGRPTATQDQTGARTTTTYDADGRVATRTDALNRTTTWTYDGLGRVATVQSPDNITYTYHYNLRGELDLVESARGGRWEFGYSPAGRLIREKDPNGRETFYAHDGVGNITRLDRPGDGATRIVTTYSYDSLNRPLAVTTPDRSYVVTYDDAANATTTTVAPGNITLVRRRDALGRLIAETTTTNGTTRHLEYSWDAASNLTAFRQDGVDLLTYTYDAMNRPQTITDARRGRTFTLTHLPSGELAEVTYPSGIRKLQGWGDRGELASIEYRKPNGDIISRETYFYDAALQLKRIEDTAGERVAYQYDLRGQLTRADYRGGSYESWTYDACGNISSYLRPDLSELRGYNLADELISIDSTPTGASPVATALSYDARGNLRLQTSGAQVREFLWDSESRLLNVTDNSTPTLTADYLDDYRLSRLQTPSEGATTFTWSFDSIISEFVSGTETNFQIGLLTPDQNLERGAPNGSRETLIANQVHTTNAVVDELGDLLRTTAHGAYGHVLAGSDPGPLGFHGARRDGSTGLVYLRNRWYEPRLGRFLSRDPIGFRGGLNLYGYTGNNPISRRDPTGLWWPLMDPNSVGGRLMRRNRSRIPSPTLPFRDDNADCFRYALNDPAQDGEEDAFDAFDKSMKPGNNEYEIKDLYRRLGLTPPREGEPIPSDYWRIAAVRDNHDGAGWRYHFYREDSPGLWTQKNGPQPVTELDSKGRLVTDPRALTDEIKADGGAYSEWIGYLYVPPDYDVDPRRHQFPY